MTLVLTKIRPDVVALGEKIFQVQNKATWMDQKSCQGWLLLYQWIYSPPLSVACRHWGNLSLIDA